VILNDFRLASTAHKRSHRRIHCQKPSDTRTILQTLVVGVWFVVRNLEAGRVVAQRITHATGNHEVFVRPLDLADQQSIAAFVAGWLQAGLQAAEAWVCWEVQAQQIIREAAAEKHP
jgi:hypothetical protein